MAGLEPLESHMFGKKTSAVRAFTDSLGITKPEPSGWQRFKASSSQFWADDRASISAWYDRDHQRKLELARAKGSVTIGFVGPAPEKPSVVLGAIAWVVEHPAEAAAAAALGAAAGTWIVDRLGVGAPKAEPDPKA